MMDEDWDDYLEAPLRKKLIKACKSGDIKTFDSIWQTRQLNQYIDKGTQYDAFEAALGLNQSNMIEYLLNIEFIEKERAKNLLTGFFNEACFKDNMAMLQLLNTPKCKDYLIKPFHTAFNNAYKKKSMTALKALIVDFGLEKDEEIVNTMKMETLSPQQKQEIIHLFEKLEINQQLKNDLCISRLETAKNKI